MDARELTKAYNELQNEHIEVKKQVEYLTSEIEKLRLLFNDLKMDVRMMERMKG